MNRRDILELVVCFFILITPGCSQLNPSPDRYRLWFIRIHNGGVSEEDVTIRVNRNDERVFEEKYEKIPSFRDRDQSSDEFTFAESPNTRLITNEWEQEPASFEIEYKITSQDEWQTATSGNDGVENRGLDLQVLGGGMNNKSMSENPIEFDSKQEAVEFLEESSPSE